jgi:hypothetical protein
VDPSKEGHKASQSIRRFAVGSCIKVSEWSHQQTIGLVWFVTRDGAISPHSISGNIKRTEVYRTCTLYS